MFVRTLDDVRASGLEVVIAGGSARTARFLTASDGVGFAFSDVHQGAGGEAHLWYKHHWEANYIVEGTGEVEEVATGRRCASSRGRSTSSGRRTGTSSAPRPTCA